MKKVLIGLLLAILLALQYQLWIGEGSLPHLWAMEKQIAKQQAENDRLKLRNEQLESEVGSLKHDLNAVEARARREHGLIKEGETFYQIVDEDTSQ